MYLWSGAFIFLLASAHADTADYSAPATVSGVPTVTVQNAAQVMSQQLRSDVGAAVDSFSQAFAADSNDPKARETAESIQTLVRNGQPRLVLCRTTLMSKRQWSGIL